MSWSHWEIGVFEKNRRQLSDIIMQLMSEVMFELDDPGLNQWYDAGVQIGDGELDVESVLVYRELQETTMTDIDGTMVPGYTLTLQFSDGQQDTESFYEDSSEQSLRQCADYFAERIIQHVIHTTSDLG